MSKTAARERAEAEDTAAALRAQRKDRRARRTRRHIAEVALRLFEEKGFAATTIDEIAQGADYSTSTFFRMFADKEEVAFHDFGERLDELRAAFARPHDGSPWLTIRAAFVAFARHWDEDGELAWRRARLFHDEPTLKFRYLAKNHQWEQAIATLVAAELGAVPDADLVSHLIAGAAVTAFRTAWQSQLRAKNKTALTVCVDKAFDQLESLGPVLRALQQPAANATLKPPKRARRASHSGGAKRA